MWSLHTLGKHRTQERGQERINTFSVGRVSTGDSYPGVNVGLMGVWSAGLSHNAQRASDHGRFSTALGQDLA